MNQNYGKTGTNMSKQISVFNNKRKYFQNLSKQIGMSFVQKKNPRKKVSLFALK